jgi:phosphate transport system substrate-binding protein
VGAGIQKVLANDVDFGATEAPLSALELRKAGLVQFPAIIGGVVPVVNLADMKPGDLKLTGAVLADIYMGRIRKWDDRRTAELNPGVKLPHEAVIVVRRSDASGTTFLWTDYLAKASPEWRQKIGIGTVILWPEGVGGRGNEGVASYLERIKGAIGYVEYAYARAHGLKHVSLRNRDGQFVQPSASSFRAAAAAGSLSSSSGFNTILTEQPGHGSWPITGASFVLIRANSQQPSRVLEVMKYFD